MKMKKIIALVLVLITVATLVMSCGSDGSADKESESETKPATETNTDEAAKVTGKTAMSCGSYEFTDAHISYMYHTTKSSLVAYASYYGLDTEKSLKEQDCPMSEGMSWYEFLMSDTKEMAEQILSLCVAADEKGVTLGDEENEKLDSTMKSLDDAVSQYNSENGTSYTADEYVAKTLAEGVKAEDIRSILSMSALANKYLEVVLEETDTGDEALEAYYEKNAEKLGEKDETCPRNVRHILFKNDTYEDDSKAREIYDAWVAGGADPEEFKALVTKFSEDPGSVDNGGLYEDITKDSSYVEPFLNWIFEDGRKIGDHGIVETEYGWHIMYLDSEGDRPVWKDKVKNALLDETYSISVESATEEHPVTVFDDVIDGIGE